jgi:hypothetical protein
MIKSPLKGFRFLENKSKYLKNRSCNKSYNFQIEFFILDHCAHRRPIHEEHSGKETKGLAFELKWPLQMAPSSKST